MPPMLMKTVDSFEPVLKQKLRESTFHYHALFEKFRLEVLLPDAETGEGGDANQEGRLTFSTLEESALKDLPPSCAAEEMPAADRLFLHHFINNRSD